MRKDNRTALGVIWVMIGLIGLIAMTVGCGGQPSVPPPAAQPTTAGASQPTEPPKVTSPMAAAVAAVKNLKGAEREKKLYEEAKKEVAFQLYTSMSVVDSTAFIEAFMKKYPGIEAKALRSDTADMYARVLTEARANQYFWDVLTIAPETVYSLDQEGLFVPWDAPVRSELREPLRDPKGIWTGMYMNTSAAVWNTKLVKPEDAPKKYEDFADPKWKGKFSVEQAEYHWAYYLFQTMGKDKALDLLKKIAANKPRLVSGMGNQINLLIAGEVSAVVVTNDTAALKQMKVGAPLDLIGIEPVRVTSEPAMLGKNAKHPYASLLFLDWLMSKEGQEFVVATTGRISVRQDVPPTSDVQVKALSGKYVQIPIDELGKNYDDTKVVFNQIFGLTK